jgi:hypothetical protein
MVKKIYSTKHICMDCKILLDTRITFCKDVVSHGLCLECLAKRLEAFERDTIDHRIP